MHKDFFFEAICIICQKTPTIIHTSVVAYAVNPVFDKPVT